EKEAPAQAPPGMQGNPNIWPGATPATGPGMPGPGMGRMIRVPWDLVPVSPNAEKYLEMIQIDMPRLMVEKHLAPMSGYVAPVDTNTGPAVLLLAYKGEISRHIPHLMPNISPDSFVPGEYLIRLEFDGSAENHPLRTVRIYQRKMP